MLSPKLGSLLAQLENTLRWEISQALPGLPVNHIRQPTDQITSPLSGTLADLHAAWDNCNKCQLANKRSSIVFGEGSSTPRLVFVGEGPGAEEDKTGRPFVGAAGELLTRMIKAMGLEREEVFITNIVKCRPPNNRDPNPDEVLACKPLLEAQLKILRPEVIVTLGRPAVQALLETKAPISKLRGRWMRLGSIDLLPTYHPAFLLRKPAEKGPVWEDLQAVLRRLGLPIPDHKRKSAGQGRS